MTEITTGELPKPSSALNEQFVTLESEEDLREQADYACTTIHDLITNRSKAKDKDDKAGIYTWSSFKPQRDGKDFLQANVPSFHTNSSELYEVRELPYDRQGPVSMYDLGERKIISVPQCHMLQVPRTSNSYLYMTMSSCSAVVGKTDTDLYVAHVGLSERGGLAKFAKFMNQQGVKPEDMYAIASLCPITDSNKGAKTALFDSTRVENIDDFTGLGIPHDHIRPFNYFPKEADQPMNLAGVVVTPRYIASYQYDYRASHYDHDKGKIPPMSGNARDVEVWEL